MGLNIPSEDDSWGRPPAEPQENEDFLPTGHCHSTSQPQNKTSEQDIMKFLSLGSHLETDTEQIASATGNTGWLLYIT